MSPELLFYDGHCGLCHGVVKFVLARDPEGAAFRFAPVGGTAFEQQVPLAERDALPDSMAVLTAEGALLVRSDAAIHVFRKLGGAWALLGSTLRIVPRPIRDAVYDVVARHRKRWFGEVEDSCPIVPAPLRTRFDA